MDIEQDFRTLFEILSNKGLKPSQINKYVSDIVDVYGMGGYFSVSHVNNQLKKSGWSEYSVDGDIIELMIAILKREYMDSADLSSTLFMYLSGRGMDPSQVKKLVEDLFKIVRDGGVFTVGHINSELERLGWYDKPVNEEIVELLLAILKKEFKYSVNSHTVH